MKFDDFMNLTVGEGVVIRGIDATVTKITDTKAGEQMCFEGITITAQKSMRRLEVSFVSSRTGKVDHLYPVLFVDFPDSVHNRVVLNSMSMWDPFNSSPGNSD